MTRRSLLIAGTALAIVGLIFFTRRVGASPPGMTGEIVKIDYHERRIQVVENSGMECWFRCVESTNLTLNGFAASFNQLAPGQRVEVQYEPDTFIAIQVDATTPGPSK